MGHVETSGTPYMRTYLADILMKTHRLYVPERGAGALSRALADACGGAVRVSTPVRRVPIMDGAASSVITDDGPVAADAVICALPATRVADVVPDLSAEIRNALGKITYSTGIRVVMGLDRPPLPAGWHGALYPEDETPLLLDRSINLSIAPPGKSTLDLLVGRDRAEELLPLDDEEIKRRLLGDARRNPPPGSALPRDGADLFTRVYRWSEAVCMAPPGMFKAMAGVRRARAPVDEERVDMEAWRRAEARAWENVEDGRWLGFWRLETRVRKEWAELHKRQEDMRQRLDRYHKGERAALGKAHGNSARQIERKVRGSYRRGLRNAERRARQVRETKEREGTWGRDRGPEHHPQSSPAPSPPTWRGRVRAMTPYVGTAM